MKLRRFRLLFTSVVAVGLSCVQKTGIPGEGAPDEQKQSLSALAPGDGGSGAEAPPMPEAGPGTPRRSSTRPSQAPIPPPASAYQRVDSQHASTRPALDQTYVLQPGDTLSKLARRFYGNARAWRRIYEANSETIKDPDRLPIGESIRIPR
jgi:nucleoid-associated protein YgaU